MLFYTLLVFSIIDYLSGSLKAATKKELSSDIGFKGICKKFLMFCIVGVAHLLDRLAFSDGAVLRTAAIFFYLSNEGLSLLENAAYLGVPIPAKLKAVLAQLHNKDKEDNDNE